MQTRLFLGFRLHETLQEALSKTPKGLSQLFLNGGEYLTTLSQNECQYLGKFASSPLSWEEIQMLEAHIKSILCKLIPPTLVRPLGGELIPFFDAQLEKAGI